jgi:hypothetical protein
VVENSTTLEAVTPASPSGTAGVTVSNPDGNSATTNNAFAFGNAPDVTSPPADLAVNLGQTAQFQIQVTGDPMLGYQWQYNGASLFENSHTLGTKTATLTINNASTADAGFYRCVVTNLYAAVTSTAAVLSVVTAPSSAIVTPAAAATGAGGSASFSVAAGGTAPFAYQWYQNGGLLAGQTGSVLNLDNLQAAASYTVVVANSAGSVTSAPVRLTLLSYCASVQVAHATYPEGTTFIPLSVTTFGCGSAAPAPNSPAAVWLYTAGTSRMLPVTTDASGNGTALFTPLPVETGLVQYGVALPGQGPPAATGSCSIICMNFSAASE